MFIEEQNGLTLKNGLKKIYKNKGIQKWIPFFYLLERALTQRWVIS